MQFEGVSLIGKVKTYYFYINLLEPNINESGRTVGPLNSRTATKVAAQ